MRAYSMDIRERVIENLDHESMRKTAKRFRVSEYFVYRLKQRYREAGTLAPKPHGGGHGPLVDEAGGEFIREVLAEASDFTLNELCERYEGRFACKVSKSSMDRALRRLNLTGKKDPLRPQTEGGTCSPATGCLHRGAPPAEGGADHQCG
jgi:transposase